MHNLIYIIYSVITKLLLLIILMFILVKIYLIINYKQNHYNIMYFKFN